MKTVNGEQLLADRVRRLYDRGLFGVTATFINGCILTYVLWGQVKTPNLMVWLSGLSLVCIIRLSVTVSYRKATPSSREAPKWKTRFLASIFITGVLWGSPAIFLFPSSSIGHQVFIAFVTGGMVAGGASIFAPILSAYYLFSVPALLPLLIRYFSIGSEIHIAMGLMILLFFLIMSIAAILTHQDYLRMLTSGYENQELVEELKRNNQQIETIIETRTKELKKAIEKLGKEIIARKEAYLARRQAEKQLQTLNEELEQRVERRTVELQEMQLQFLHTEKLSEIGKLSASIAHEFNNPLQSVMTTLKCLRLTTPEHERDLLEAAITESERMKNLIQNLRDYNRPSSGDKKIMDVHASISLMLLLCKSDFKRKRINTVLNLDQRLPQIWAIPDQIKQVILNLLNNAADACFPNGGTIKISTWHDEKRIAIAIKDDGVGIDPDKIHLIFKPFFTSKAEHLGTGLGLSICHEIVKKHEGEIYVVSQPGEGSTFTILLPLNKE